MDSGRYEYRPSLDLIQIMWFLSRNILLAAQRKTFQIAQVVSVLKITEVCLIIIQIPIQFILKLNKIYRDSYSIRSLHAPICFICCSQREGSCVVHVDLCIIRNAASLSKNS